MDCLLPRLDLGPAPLNSRGPPPESPPAPAVGGGVYPGGERGI